MKNENMHIVLFDDTCNICSRLLHYIATERGNLNIKAASQHSDIGRAIYGHFDIDPEDTSGLIYIEGEKIERGAVAIVNLARNLGRNAGPFRYIQALPLILLKLGYYVIAKNRYRIFGRRRACPLPGPEVRSILMSEEDLSNLLVGHGE